MWSLNTIQPYALHYSCVNVINDDAVANSQRRRATSGPWCVCNEHRGSVVSGGLAGLRPTDDQVYLRDAVGRHGVDVVWGLCSVAFLKRRSP